MAKELTAEELQRLSDRVTSLLGEVDLKGVSSESTGFDDLPEGYFLCKVELAQLKESNSGDPQVALRLKSIEDGYDLTVDEKTQSTIINTLKKTKGRMLFKYYTWKEAKDIKKCASDLMKFEIGQDRVSIPEEAFSNFDTLVQALELIEEATIYVNISHQVREDGSKSVWTNLISWKRASDLGLPTE